MRLCEYAMRRFDIAITSKQNVLAYGPNANNREGDPMKKFMISAAALIAVAAFVTVPASADYVGGGPRVQNGKCWLDLAGPRDGRYGVWRDCPKGAAASDSTCKLGQLAWEKIHVGFLYFDICTGFDVNGKPIAGSAAHR
jgi:hypothetical protein